MSDVTTVPAPQSTGGKRSHLLGEMTNRVRSGPGEMGNYAGDSPAMKWMLSGAGYSTDIKASG